MKKVTKMGIVLYLVMLCLVGCGNSKKYNDVQSVFNSFKEKGVPIIYSIVYDDSNDPNGLNQHAYKQKGNFADSRIESTYSEEEPLSGTVEIFENTEKATKRINYLEQLDTIDSFDYKFQKDNVVIRLSGNYTQEQISEFIDILDGKEVVISTNAVNNNTENNKTGKSGETVKMDVGNDKLTSNDFSYNSYICEKGKYAKYRDTAVTVTNNGKVASGVNVQVSFLNEENTMIDSQDGVISIIDAGATQCIVINSDSDYSSVSVTITPKDNNYYLPVDNTIQSDYSIQGAKCVGTLKNTGTQDIEFLQVYCLFFNGDSLVKAESRYVGTDDKLAAGDTAPFSVNASNNITFDSVKLYFSGRIPN